MPRPVTPPWFESHFGPVVLRQLLEQLADATDGALFAVDADCTVVYWSRSAERRLGRSAAEAVGGHCLRAVPCDACLSRCALVAADAPHTARLRDPLGGEREWRRTVLPLHGEDGTFLGGIELLLPQRAGARAPGPVQRGHLGPLRTADPEAARTLADASVLAPLAVPLHLQAADLVERWLLAEGVHAASLRPEALRPLRLGEPLTAALAAATTGTLWIDDLPSLTLDAQLDLLRVLGRGPQARILTGSTRPLATEVRAGRIRPELAAVLDSATLVLPALSQRPADIEAEALDALEQLNLRGDRQVSGLSAEAMEALRARPWPGGRLELRAVVARAWASAESEVRGQDLPVVARPVAEGGEQEPSAETRRILRALRNADGNVSAAAAALGISRSTLYRRRLKLGI